jgi:hypothetical protein
MFGSVKNLVRILLLGLLGLFSVGLTGPTPASGQVAEDICSWSVRVGSARLSAACLDARRFLWISAEQPAAPPEQKRIKSLPTRLYSTYRSAYAVDRNDGSLWSGRGGAVSATSGVFMTLGPVRLAIEPQISWSENRAFSLPDTTVIGLSRFADPWVFAAVDHYLRPGSGARFRIDPGSSFVEVEGAQGRLGVSNERLWWGPARRYPLLFSGTAPGFWHAYVEAGPNLKTPVGRFHAQLLWGRLDESKWFDADPGNDHRLLGAFQVAWSSDFVPGLEVAYSVVRHEPLPRGDFRLGQLGQLFTGDGASEDPMHVGVPMGSLGLRFAYPDEGFEAYAEIGRGDYLLVPEPGVSDGRHSLIYIMGFSRTVARASGNAWRITGEVLKQSLELPQPGPDPATPPRTFVAQGHTNQGQVLGAYVGPGSNAQYVTLDHLGEGFSWGVFAERVRRNDDTYFRTHAYDYGFRGHDLEWTLGARLGAAPKLAWIGSAAFSAEFGASRRKNRSFVGLEHGENRVFLREWNLWGEFLVRLDRAGR